MTMTLIETITVGSGGVSSMEFTGIPQDGKDLLVLLSARGENDLTDLVLNGVTTTSYTDLKLRGTGSSVSSFGSTSEAAKIVATTNTSRTANTFGNSSYLISNYTSATNKSISMEAVTENNATYSNQEIGAATFTTTSPITSVELSPNGANDFVEYSTASLYIIS